MNLETKGSLRILTPRFGYILHDKLNDIYSEKIYLGIYANIDDYEEVIKEGVDILLYDKVAQLEDLNNLIVSIFDEVINS